MGSMARVQEDDPETWETSNLHLVNRCDGGPVINPPSRCGFGTQLHRREEEALPRVVGRVRGKTGATADGEEESEDCKVAMKPGNRTASEPGRAKAVRVNVNFWRET